MVLERRKELIAQLESQLDARLLVLVTGDRLGMETRIAPDVLPLISDHVSRIGNTKRLALFLYTPGGDSIAGWGLVNILRQYCQRFVVLVPFRALSCGTLVALGADEVVIGRHGLLSPVDPSVASPYTPALPGSQEGGPTLRLPVSVEDMLGFLDLAREEVNLKSEASMVEVLKILAQQVHPLALGAVYRAREQNTTLASRLLEKHMKDLEQIRRIVNCLTKELPTHNYLIGRREAAEEIGLPIIEAPDDVDSTMWALYKQYQVWMKLIQPTSPELDLGKDQQKNIRYDRAAVESLKDGILFQHVFVSDVDLIRLKGIQPGMQVPVEQVVTRILYQGWIAGTDGEESR